MKKHRLVTAEIFREFPRRLLIAATKPLFLIVDAHPIHKAKLSSTFYEASQRILKLFHPPRYPQHLIPEEQAWAHVKRKVTRQLAQPNDKIKRLALDARPISRNFLAWQKKSSIARLVSMSQYIYYFIKPESINTNVMPDHKEKCTHAQF